MAAGAVNGTLTKIKVNSTEVNLQMDCSITYETDTIDTTSKDSSGWEENIPGLRRWSISASGIYSLEGTGVYNFNDLLAFYVSRAQVSIEYKTTGVGGHLHTGTATITSLESSSPLEDKIEMSLEFKGTGQPTLAVNP